MGSRFSIATPVGAATSDVSRFSTLGVGGQVGVGWILWFGYATRFCRLEVM